MSFNRNTATQILSLGVMSFTLSAPWLQAQQPNAAPEQSAINSVDAVAQGDDPELKPVNPPSVICKDGSLSIKANNSTLAAVLQSVRACTGTEMEMPDSAAEERLFASLGPGPVKQILTSLLGDTDFNYLIQTSDSDSTKVRAVVLMARGNSGPGNVASTTTENSSPSRRAWQQARRNALESTTGQLQDSESSASDSVQTQSAETGVSVAPPVGMASPTDSSSSEAAIPIAESATPKVESAATATDSTTNAGQQNATQQLIQDMRRMFEERRQMQERQTSPQRK